ncbi:MAG TPA: prepilin peptidase [Candidatus Paceibacterota bacterium]|nr:prepilin peptidase [Candidatus Paceibacterota bacterium]
MTPLLCALFFCLGALLASFAGLLAARLYTGEPIAAGRSRCDACGAALSAPALVPLAGWALSAGRARCCGARISAASAVGELALGTLFLFSYLKLGLSWPLTLLLPALVLLYALVRYDLAHQILPPVLLAPLGALSLGYAALAAPSAAAFLSALIVAAAEGVLLLALSLLSRGRLMGLADAPLIAALALVAAPRALAGFAFSFWIGALIGIILVLAGRGRVRMKSEVPLAPFLAAGFLLAYFIPWDPFAALIALIG